MLRRAGYIITILGLLVTGTLPMAWAARQQQGRVRRLKACVLIVPTMGEPTPSAPPANPFAGGIPDPDALSLARSPNPHPLIFKKLDDAGSLKPDNWQFYNPASPAFATREQAARWNGTLIQGAPLRSDVPAYWEVLLSRANYARLAEMDVVYLPVARANANTPAPMFFTEEQRQVLSLLVDAGVTLWVDYAYDAATQPGLLGGNEIGTPTGPTDLNKSSFFTNLDTATGGNIIAPAVGHPLLTAKYRIGATDAVLIGTGVVAGNPPTAAPGRAFALRAAGVQPTSDFTAVVPTSAGSPYVAGYIAAARYGAGFIVATAGNVGGAIDTPANVPSDTEDLKFAYNVFAWRDESTTQQRDGRHTSQTSAQNNGLIEAAAYPYLVNNGGNWQPFTGPFVVNPAPPLMINGLVIAATQAPGQAGWELSAFDQNPTDDFNGDGAPDDPVVPGGADPSPDLAIGQPYDRVDTIQPNFLGNAPILGLSVGELPDPQATGAGSKAFIFGTATSGLFIAPAPRPGMPAADYWVTGNVTPAPAAGVTYTGSAAVANIPGVPLGTPPTPSIGTQVYAGGVATGTPFGTAGGSGKLVAFDVNPANQQMAGTWFYPPSQEANRLGPVAGPVTTAQLQDTGTGAIDTMVFISSLSSGDQAAQQQADTSGKVEGFIVATRGDVLGFPRGANTPVGNNPQGGRRFVSVRWQDIPPGQGVPPTQRELMWDDTRHYEVRILDKRSGYVVGRFVPGMAGFRLLPDGTAGQVELPDPATVPVPVGLAPFQDPNQRGAWNLTDYVLVADYSPLPIPVDNGGATIRPRFSPATPYFRGTNVQPQPTGVAGGVSVGPDNLVYYGTGQGYMCAAEWRRGRAQFRWKMRSLDYQDQTGFSKNPMMVNATGGFDATGLQDYAFTAAPAAGSRIIFASKGLAGNGEGTAYIVEPDATVKFKLSPSFTGAPGAYAPVALPQLTEANAQDIMLEADHGIAVNPNSPFIMSTQQPWGRVPGQFSVDPDTGTVTFLNMENFSLNMQAALSPAELGALGISSGGRPMVPIRWKFRGEADTAARTAFVPLPLVATYHPSDVPQEQFLSGPVIAGDRAYLMGKTGLLHELPLDPKTLDPAFPRPLPGLAGFNLGNIGTQATPGPYYPNGLRRVKEVAATGVPSIAPPAVSEGALAAVTSRGLTLYKSSSVVVADSNRIIEASGDSTAVAATDVSVKQRFDNDEMPVPTDAKFIAGTTPPILTERKALSRPAVVRKLDRLSSLTAVFQSTIPGEPPVDNPNAGVTEHSRLAESSYLVADTGNNRAVEYNPAGKVVWELTDFQDPFGLLAAGESQKLSGPMDVQRWVEPETVGNATIYDVHTLIADTGNFRVLEIVDKIVPQNGFYTPGSFFSAPAQVAANGQPIRWYHVVVWSSQTNAQGLKIRYRTAQRIEWPDAAGNRIATPAGGAGFPASAVPPFLPRERALTYTMCSVAGQRISYPDARPPNPPSTYSNFFRFFNGAAMTQAVADRKPVVTLGGDSIVFLRGRYKVDETSPAAAVQIPDFREAPASGNASGGDRFRFSQGVIDPNIPIITDILAGNPLTVVHRLDGVQSVQRTIRVDARWDPGLTRGQYFLVADRGGVFEARLLPAAAGPPATPPLPVLAWVFGGDDYAYVTGAGNGNPTQINSPGAQTPGGRLLSAASARRLSSGLVLITSRTPANDQPPAGGGVHRTVGADVFILRPTDYNPAAPARGWKPDLWVQNFYAANVPPAAVGAPSIRWRAAAPVNPAVPPTARAPLVGGDNPTELTGTYVPAEPNYADLNY